MLYIEIIRRSHALEGIAAFVIGCAAYWIASEIFRRIDAEKERRHLREIAGDKNRQEILK